MFEELGFRQVLCINQNNNEHAQIKYEAVFANCIKREVGKNKKIKYEI